MSLMREEDFESMTLLDWVKLIVSISIVLAIILLTSGCLVSLPPIPTSIAL